MMHSSSDTPLDESLAPKPSPWPKLPGKSWGFLLGGVVILAGGVWGIRHLIQPTATPETVSVHPIAVVTQTLHTQPLASTLELSGTIRPLEQAVLSTRVNGRITQLSLEAGDRFRKGEVLARIDVLEMAAQTNQAQAGVTQAQAELSRSQATLSQLQAQQTEAQANFRLAEINQRRMAQLRSDGAVSQSQLDDANTALEAAKARVAQTIAGMAQSQAAIEQAQAAVNQARSGVTVASANESYGQVFAPFDGVVVQKLAYEGEMAAPGTALLKVENPDRLQLEISVPEENLRFVKPGQSVTVSVEASNLKFNAVIQQIVPSADPTSRSFLVKIPMPRSDRLISGMFGRIALPRGSQPGLFIPKSALIQRGQLQGVYVVDASAQTPIAVLRWIKLGKTTPDQVEVLSGLSEGDRLITTNLSQLSDGQAITPQ